MPSYTNPRSPVSMEWNLTELDKFIKEFVAGTEYDTAAAIRYVSRELGMNIVSRTPVGKTKRAVAGWSKIGKALNFSVPSSSSSKSGDSTYKEHLSGPEPYVQFNNNVPYAIYLEYGWSGQAPLGMVRISIAEMKSSGMLPTLLASSYEARWYKRPGERYAMQEAILSKGLLATRIVVPSRRSVSARLSAQLRGLRKRHRPSAVLARIQKEFRS